MLKKCILVFVLFLISNQEALAISNPTQVPNNKFGIHIIDENDLSDAAKLVNSSGGDWGYVKIVIRQDDRNQEKWQAVFDRMRQLHLIPIVRLATKVNYGAWQKPPVDDIGSWVDFLNSLNWVVENRYVIIFNEPNHADEWGGEVNPEEYAWFLKEFSTRLKSKSADFFILPAGLDASAPNGGGTMDEATFIKRMTAKETDIFKNIDGWTSHSYPNPGFSGSPYATGKGSIQTYKWEMSQFSYLGISELPIFITETGWRHNQGKYVENYSLTPEQAAENYKVAYTEIWNDSKIAAVVPFLLNYQDAPFDHFSFKKLGSHEFYATYSQIQDLTKVTGNPKQKDLVEIIDTRFPDKLVTGSDYALQITLENNGQSIIDGHAGWNFSIDGLPNTFQVYTSTLSIVEPFHRTQVEVRLKTPSSIGDYSYVYKLTHYEKNVLSSVASLSIIPPPGILVNAKIWYEHLAQGNDFQLIIYNDQEQILHEEERVEFKDGGAKVENLYNIIPNHNYRIVLTKPYYLPRQIYAHLTDRSTTVYFPQLLPLDPSSDGSLSLGDVGGFLKRPLKSIGLLISL